MRPRFRLRESSRARRCLPAVLFACVAAAGLDGCRDEASEKPVIQNQVPSALQQAPQPEQPRQKVVKSIDFASELYLKDVCSDSLSDLPFKRFKSYDFVYDNPLPVRVSGAYYEVRGKDAASADTVYDEIEATIFRDVEMVVESDHSAPAFSFDRWAVPFAVSDHPFSASRQLKHERAMGATFPFLDLAGIPFHDPADSGRPDSGGSNFSRNFISALNFLATRGENIWGNGTGFDERAKARELRHATTATDYERRLSIRNDDLAALKAIPPGEKLSVDGRGHFILVALGKPARFVAAIDIATDAVGLRACGAFPAPAANQE